MRMFSSQINGSRQYSKESEYSWIGLLLGLMLFLSMPVASAANTEQNPYKLIEGVSDQLLEVIRTSGKNLESNPQSYYAAVDRVLEPVVAFEFIARSVMGDYAKQATAVQRARFTQVFRRDLVGTLARGVASFGDLDVKVENPGGLPKGKQVSVLQEVRSKDGLTRVSYSLARNRAGQWKLINVILNGVNLGKTFKAQFAQSMQVNGGDIDKVIASWSSGEVADKVS